MRRPVLAALALLLAAAPQAQTATEPADLVRAMEDAVARLDYVTAEARAREALARFDALSPDQLVTVHTALGVLLHARNEAVEARRQFEAALSLDPALALDPVLVSPKTLQFFEDVKATAQTASGPPAAPAIRYVVLTDPRPSAAVRSLVLPGWGQFYKGDRTKGWAFAVAGGTLAVSTLAADVARAQARADYNSARTEAEAERLHGPYNRWHRARNALAIGTAAVWAGAALDALATGGPEPPDSFSLAPAPDVGGVRLRIGL